MMGLGLRYYDSSTPPAPWQAQEAWNAGARVWGGYLAGLQAARIWTAEEWQVVRAVGFSLVGYIVTRGPNAATGQRAVIAATVAGLKPAWFRICIDQEAGWPDPSPDFAMSVRNGGYECGIYGTAADVERQRYQYDFAVIAAYDSNPKPPGPPPRTIIQNWSTHNEFGLSVDRGIADPWFYYGDNVMQYMDSGEPLTTADVVARRVKIHEWYRLFLHREVENDSVMQGHLLTWVHSGGEAVLAAIVDSAEGGQNIVQERTLLGLQ